MSVAAIIVGNEVLTAKVDEANGAHLLRRCRQRQVQVTSLNIVPDDVDAIVEAVQLARRRAPFVVTSGGIGPTHDDVTVRAVALALGRPVVVMPEMVELLKKLKGAATLSPAVERLAQAPAGSTLLSDETLRYPVLVCDDVFLLPGVPSLFQLQLELVLGRIPAQPLELRTLFVALGETDIAAALDAVALAMPDVAIGSYPTFDDAADHRVKLTVEHALATRVEAAVKALRGSLPVGSIVREATR